MLLPLLLLCVSVRNKYPQFFIITSVGSKIFATLLCLGLVVLNDTGSTTSSTVTAFALLHNNCCHQLRRHSPSFKFESSRGIIRFNSINNDSMRSVNNTVDDATQSPTTTMKQQQQINYVATKNTCIKAPKSTYCIMIHKNYQNRLYEYLYNSSSNAKWETMNATAVDRIVQQSSVALTPNKSKKQKVAAHQQQSSSQQQQQQQSSSQPNARILYTETVQGVSRAHRGYVLLLCTSIAPSSSWQYQLSPFCRKNIAWMGHVQYSTGAAMTSSPESNTATTCDSATATQHVIQGIVHELLHRDDKSLKDMNVRVDCHPKSITESICLQLQQQTAMALGDTTNITDPFVGAISMTMSMSKCTHRLIIVQEEMTDDDNVIDGNITKRRSTSLVYHWGIETNENRDEKQQLQPQSSNSCIGVPLNHVATDEIVILPANNTSGKDDAMDTCPKTPLSRAYYKLQQVARMNMVSDFVGTIGYDIGASPGGWTQSLVYDFQLQFVIAYDRAIVAERVTKSERVVHIRQHLLAPPENDDGSAKKDNDDKEQQARTTSGTNEMTHQQEQEHQNKQFQVIVCDASVNWTKLLPMIHTFVTTNTAAQWGLPFLFVITLKLPFKSKGSVANHVNGTYTMLPDYLNALAGTMFPTKKVRISYKIVHLMANSESERTLIAKLE